MSRLRKWTTALVMIVAVVAVALAGKWAVDQTKDNVEMVKSLQRQEACGGLPTRTEVEQVMSAQALDIATIKAVGSGTRVRLVMPCDGVDGAQIDILVSGEADAALVNEVLKVRPLGAPVEIKIV